MVSSIVYKSALQPFVQLVEQIHLFFPELFIVCNVYVYDWYSSNGFPFLERMYLAEK